MKLKFIGLLITFLSLSVSTVFAQDISLCENPWTGSSVNAMVAKILLEEQLGQSVEIVSIDENSMWPAIASGELSACLEIWPSGHGQDITQYIDQGVIDNMGELGVIGKISWYIPTYMLTDHPELATYEGFQNPDNAKLFATAQTGDKGAFIGGDPSFVQYDADIIKNLGMNFEVVYAGSEQAELAALDAAYSRQDPFLFYFWTPHSVHAKYDLTAVTLPAYSDECYAKAASGGVDCDYPADVLMKIAYPGLKDSNADAYTFLSKMNYSTTDQIAMIAAVDSGGESIEEAARAWIDANEAVWKNWLP